MLDGRVGTAALIFASILGVLLALGTSLEAEPGDTSSAVVTINGQVIERSEYDRALQAITSDKRNPVTDQDRERILTRLIEEELLIQRGVEIGLVDRDRTIRGAIVTAMIDHILAPSESDPVDEGDLREWYAVEANRFRPQPQIHVRPTSNTSGLAVPDGLVPASTLRDYIGPAALTQALEAEQGVAFMDDQNREYVVVAREWPTPPPFEPNRNDIETAYRRDAGDKAFRDYLKWLEMRADIERRDP